jgi:type IV pilus assembly protein PilA
MTNPTPKKSTSAATIVIISLGVGCGCLGLIVVLGILAAIALPSFLNQANKARESEAKSYMAALMRAQEAYALTNSRFATTAEQLGVTPPTTGSYTYAVNPISGKPTIITFSATPKAQYRSRLKAFTGAVQVVGKKPDYKTEGIVCQTARPSAILETFQEPVTPLACPGEMVPILNK